MKRLLSYIYPVSKTISSQYNGDLEITWYNGKKHLNSKNANYSYGSLQRILKFGLKKIELSKVDSILVLGMGGGSVIETLRQDFNYNSKITAVEIDQVIIDIAKTEYGISENENLKIYCTDAYYFALQNTVRYDLIIIDLFIDLNVPDKFLSLDFWDGIIRSKSSRGSILFNASVGSQTSSLKLDHVISYLRSKVYDISVFDNVNNTNTIVIAKGL
jgi:spermidine synthase